VKRFARDFYIKRKEGGASKTAERQREHVREAECCGEREMALAIK
jgi:hypothetical protein